jgi:uncharacterized membrane protein
MIMANLHVIAGAGDIPAHPVVRRIGLADLSFALRRGFNDFWSKPSHYVFLVLIYPIVGVILARWTFSQNALPLLYPLVSGFALLGPLAAIGLYEISRRRELGLDASWRHASDVLRSPSIPAIAGLGILLLAIFICWLATAQALYVWLFGPEAPESLTAFLKEVFITERGWTLIVLGNAIGLVFAITVLMTSVVSFPLLLDRDVGAAVAVHTSARAVLANRGPMAAWGLIVFISLLIGSIPFFVGLAVVLPILGHATWHLYRRVVEPDSISKGAVGSQVVAGKNRRLALDCPENARERLDQRLDEAEEESFPASDPIAILITR